MGINTKVIPRLLGHHFRFLSVVFCFWFSTYIYVPTFGVYLNLLDIGYYATGLILGSYGIMQVLIRFPLGILADRYQISGKWLVAWGMIASFMSAILFGLTDSFLPALFGRLLAGVTAAMWVVLTIWYSTEFHENQSMKAMGLLQTTTVASQFISMAISGWMADLLGFKSLFWIGGVFALLGLMLVISLPDGKKSREQRKMPGPGVLQIMKNGKLWTVSLLSLLVHAVLFSTIFGFSPVYFHHFNHHTAAVILLVVAFMLPHTFAPFLLSIKKGKLQNPFLTLAICFATGAGSLAFMGNTKSWLVYCILHVILGFFLGIVFPILLDQVYQADPTKTTMGFYQSFYSFGIVFGPIAAGFIAKNANIAAVFTMSAILLAVGGIIVIAAPKKTAKKTVADAM